MPRHLALTFLLLIASGCASQLVPPVVAQGPTEARPFQQGGNSFTYITGSDVEEERERWNTLFRKEQYFTGREPLDILRENVRHLPRGRALVLPMEEGRNAVYLARNGFDVTGIDYSDDALFNARNLAREYHVKVNGVNADLNYFHVERGIYDVIMVSEFYRPRLVQEVKAGLKRGGAVIFEAYTLEHRNNKVGRRDYLLKPGQLRDMFSDFEIIAYRETNDGRRAVASLVAVKR